MAAKLEWKGDVLMLGRWPLARVGELPGSGWHYALPDAESGVSEPYQEETDCRQDAEAEVRRLLKAADVEVE